MQNEPKKIPLLWDSDYSRPIGWAVINEDKMTITAEIVSDLASIISDASALGFSVSLVPKKSKAHGFVCPECGSDDVFCYVTGNGWHSDTCNSCGFRGKSTRVSSIE